MPNADRTARPAQVGAAPGGAVIRIAEVSRITGLPEIEIRRRTADGTFPRAVILTPRIRAWFYEDVCQFHERELARIESQHGQPDPTVPSRQSLQDQAAARFGRGIYLLWRGDELLYVGQTEQFSTRIAAHRAKEYDRFTFVAMKAGVDLREREAAYIRALKPALNMRLLGPSRIAG